MQLLQKLHTGINKGNGVLLSKCTGVIGQLEGDVWGELNWKIIIIHSTCMDLTEVKEGLAKEGQGGGKGALGPD